MKTSEEVLRLQRARDTLTDLAELLEEGNYGPREACAHLENAETKEALHTAVETLSEAIGRP